MAVRREDATPLEVPIAPRVGAAFVDTASFVASAGAEGATNAVLALAATAADGPDAATAVGRPFLLASTIDPLPVAVVARRQGRRLTRRRRRTGLAVVAEVVARPAAGVRGLPRRGVDLQVAAGPMEVGPGPAVVAAVPGAAVREATVAAAVHGPLRPGTGRCPDVSPLGPTAWCRHPLYGHVT